MHNRSLSKSQLTFLDLKSYYLLELLLDLVSQFLNCILVTSQLPDMSKQCLIYVSADFQLPLMSQLCFSCVSVDSQQRVS